MAAFSNLYACFSLYRAIRSSQNVLFKFIYRFCNKPFYLSVQLMLGKENAVVNILVVIPAPRSRE